MIAVLSIFKLIVLLVLLKQIKPLETIINLNNDNYNKKYYNTGNTKDHSNDNVNDNS